MLVKTASDLKKLEICTCAQKSDTKLDGVKMDVDDISKKSIKFILSKNIFYDKMELRLFYFHVMISLLLLRTSSKKIANQ